MLAAEHRDGLPDSFGAQRVEVDRLVWAALSGSRRRASVVEQDGRRGRPGDGERFMQLALALSPAMQQLLITTCRARYLTQQQLTDFFSTRKDGTSRTPGCAAKEAKRALVKLIHDHLLYRFFPPEEWSSLSGASAHYGRQALNFPGKAAVPYVSEREGVKLWPGHYIELGAKQVSAERMVHDFLANQTMVELARALRGRGGLVDVPGSLQEAYGTDLLAVSLAVQSCRGPRSIAMGFRSPLDRE